MVARSTTRSNQRPDTLMQDRSPPPRRKPLATHGRTIQSGQTRSSGRFRHTSAQAPQAELQAAQCDVAVVQKRKSPEQRSVLIPQVSPISTLFARTGGAGLGVPE